MELLCAGDIAWRLGTVGVQKEPSKTPVLILAVHRDEGIHGKPIYTCAPICDKPFRLAGDCPVKMPSGKTSTARLGKFLIAGEDSIVKCSSGTRVFHHASDQEMSTVRMKMEALLSPQQGILGTVVHSATPSHEGGRGKVNRPYVLVCEIGKGSGNYWAVPVSSRGGKAGLGARIDDLETCGLRRSEGYQSHTRLSWSASVSRYTSDLSRNSPKLSPSDMATFVPQVKNFTRMLIRGEVCASRGQEENLEGLIRSSRGIGVTPVTENTSLEAALRKSCPSITARPSLGRDGK